MKRQHICPQNEYPENHPIVRFNFTENPYWGIMVSSNAYLNITFCPHCSRRLEMDIEEAIKVIEDNNLFSQHSEEAWNVIKEKLRNNDDRL